MCRSNLTVLCEGPAQFGHRLERRTGTILIWGGMSVLHKHCLASTGAEVGSDRSPNCFGRCVSDVIDCGLVTDLDELWISWTSR